MPQLSPPVTGTTSNINSTSSFDSADNVMSLNQVLELYERDPKAAYPILLQCAEMGNSTAQVALACVLAHGDGVQKSVEDALYWYNKAAEQKNTNAMFKLGVHYQRGDIVEQSNSNAIEWCKMAAEYGHVDAMYNLGLCYYNGHIVEQDYEKAHEWFTLAANQEDEDAACYLGIMHQYGHGVEQSDATAFDYYYTLAFNNNYPFAKYKIWTMYQAGTVAEKFVSKAQALDCLKNAAENGVIAAMHDLGKYFFVNKKYPDAIKWLVRAAKNNCDKAVELIMELYQSQDVCNANAAAILTSLKQIANEGNASAAYNLGLIYRDAVRVDHDGQQALEWFTIAAWQGDPDALSAIGGICEHGTEDGVVKPDIEEATCWYELANKKNDPVAIDQLQKIYQNGKGNTDKDEEKANHFKQRLSEWKFMQPTDGDAPDQSTEWRTVHPLQISKTMTVLKLNGCLQKNKDWELLFSILKENKAIKVLDLRGNDIDKLITLSSDDDEDDEGTLFKTLVAKQALIELCQSNGYSTFEVIQSLITDNEQFNREMSQLMQKKAERMYQQRICMYS